MNDLVTQPKPASPADWKPPIDVMTEMPPLKLSEERIGEIAAQLGLIGITGDGLRALRDLGALWQGLGMIRTANSGAALTHLAAAQTIGYLTRLMEKHPSDSEIVMAAAKQIANISNALTKSSIGLAKAAPTEQGRVDPDNTRKSFLPGAVVGSVSVHYHAPKNEGGQELKPE